MSRKTDSKATAGMNAGKSLQSVGMLILLLAFVIAAIVMYFGGEDLFTENIIMLAVVVFAVLMGALSLLSIAVIIASVQTIAYMAYKLYFLLAMGRDIEPIQFCWIVIPGISILGMGLLWRGIGKLRLENNILRQQVEELVMIDPLTGFYNLRSMFMDIQTQISFAERNNNPLSLMMIKLRYPDALQTALNRTQYEAAIKKLAMIVHDTVRLEDRVYSIDDQGSLGVLLTNCDKVGNASVEKRITKRVYDPEAFMDIAQVPIRVEIKMATMEYVNALFNRDAHAYMKTVENMIDESP